MNYIVFDLEWNQPAEVRPHKDRKLQFEIIEIGAVKLDSNFKKVAEFSQLVRPTVYKKLNWHTQKMLNIGWGELRNGRPFPEVMKRFQKWCGEDVVYCMWGTQDLTELQRNMAYYKLNPLSDGPISFLNIQKLFAHHIKDSEKVYNLELAVDTAGLEKDIPFHRAYADAYYTAKILQLINKEDLHIGKTYDLYHIPVNKKAEIQEYDEGTYYYVSHGYSQREQLTQSRRAYSMCCYKCNAKGLRPKIRWFSNNSKLYLGAAICEEHGAITGRLKVKQDDSGTYYVEKWLTYADISAIDDLKELKQSRKKRKKAEEQKSETQ